MAVLREAMSGRCPVDPVAVLLGRVAQSLAASGAVDQEIALSYVVWLTAEMLQAVAESGA